MSKWSWCCCIATVVVIYAVIMAFIFIFVHSPPKTKELEFTVSDASLAGFSYSTATPNNTLSYSLTLNITIRNPNEKGGLYFDQIQVIANYSQSTFSVVTLTSTPLYLGANNTTVLNSILLQGRQSVLFEESDLEKYRLETSRGVYSVDVKLALRLRDVRFRKGKVVGSLEPPKVECDDLKVPLRKNNGSSSSSFKATWTVSKELEFTVSDSSLEEFSFTTPNNELSYGLKLNITIRNPNKKGGLYLDQIQVIANYSQSTFSVVTLTSTPIYLGANNRTVLDSIVLQGRQSVLFEESNLEKYRLETSYGVYSIDVNLALRLRDVRFRHGKVVDSLEPPKIECNNLKVPLRKNNGGNSSFMAKRCMNVYIFTKKLRPYHEFGYSG
ncbi:hypothetical protein TorRG33x02_211130 [Trema orientale]|uniref:Late embryogenesis abundant protein n=1 Tax=Trema orientale TaxID=63057 RepID=A0A2P5EC63_TREOI|nr:hypothetical protein TorRG33x02_211130 [Trema orientale]